MKTILKIIIGIIILLGVFLFMFFAYNKYNNTLLNSTPVPSTGQLPANISVAEEEGIKELAENFVYRYYSYVWGSFFGAELQYENMTEELRNKEDKKNNEAKAAMVGQPRKFLTVQADVIDSKIDEYEIGKKAVLTVRMNLKEIDGALVTSAEVPDISPYTSGWVGSDGKTYVGYSNETITKKSVESVIMVLIKVGNIWKIDGFSKIE